jgi:glycosyltransferase involved in cell wall biosynthesis
LLGRFTDAILAVSTRVRHDIEAVHHIARSGRVKVVPLGFDLSRFAAIDGTAKSPARVALGLDPAVKVVTTVGRLTAIKQQHLFLDMASRLAVDHPNIAFLIVGDGSLRRNLERQSHDLGIADAVRFLGWRGDLPRIYAATDVFVLTSANEGTPVALIEALASGVAGISTDVGGVADVIRPNCGVLVPANDVVSLTAAVSALLSNPDRRAALGSAGRDSVTSRFTVSRLEQDVVQLYRELLD